MPSLTLDLFADPEPAPIRRHQNLTVDREKMRAATERSRALREDLVFPKEKTSLLPLTSLVRWECHFCRALNVVRREGALVLPVGESAWFTCDECRRDQHLQRTGEDFTDPNNWEFMMGLVAHGDIPRKESPAPRGADAFAMARLEDQWPHAYAFVAQARKHGHTDPSLTPVVVSAAGRREFDIEELARFANELLRGVRSTRPTMTPERWGEAIAKVRESGGAS